MYCRRPGTGSTPTEVQRAGVDGVSLSSIKESKEGVPGLLKELQRKLREKTYLPMPVRLLVRIPPRA